MIYLLIGSVLFYFVFQSFYKKEKKIIISIDGLPGVGKTTLIEKLKQLDYIAFVNEPVESWLTITDENGDTILKKFYEDKIKYSFSFQILAYITRLIELEKTKKDKKKIIITERSLHTDKYVFELSLYESKLINMIEHKIYNYWFDYFIKDYKTDKIIYINASPEVCRERIIKRNRKGEENVDLEYLKKCVSYHEQMLTMFSPKNVLILDGNKNIEYTDRWIAQIERFIKS